MVLTYNTRDGKGRDIVKQVQIKRYDTVEAEFVCKICNTKFREGVPIKKIVSSNFTDWAHVGDYVCTDCTRYFSLYFYNYIVSDDTIRLLNVREMCEEIQKPQSGTFKIVISISQKKHLFYHAANNNNPEKFIANLENEQIYCDRELLVRQFALVGSLQTLGESKSALARGEFKFGGKLGVDMQAHILRYMQTALCSRQIQIPLHLSQKLEISEEEALCNLDSILSQS